MARKYERGASVIVQVDILRRLIRKRGRNAKLIDWIDELTADCSKRIAYNINDPCGVRCPGLSKVL